MLWKSRRNRGRENMRMKMDVSSDWEVKDWRMDEREEHSLGSC